MNRRIPLSCLAAGLIYSACAFGATTVPTDVQMPGTQPNEIGTLESPNKCDNCHGGYNSAVEPAHNWRGSMMAHAGRDPIFWATLAVAEQDFDGAGDLCIRCHSTGGWLAGRSTPTDGSGLAAMDSDGVECDYCHKLTNPDDSEHPGNQFEPFVANSGPVDYEGYYGSGMSSMWGGSDKLGPYNDADARHQFMQSRFHRDPDFCGTCHDVSNPVTGDLSHNHGQMLPPGEDPVVFDGTPGSPVDGKAAFNNPPYAYGVVERTFSEYKSGKISQTLVDDYGTPGALDEDFPFGGALQAVYDAATGDGAHSADYQNPAMPRYFSCQTCHMRALTGKGANKRGVPTRTDLPLHDMTGGNYWMPQAIAWLDTQGALRLGGGMTQLQLDAMADGASRALQQLRLAASLSLEDEGTAIKIRITNHTGHKLISGYPEGRRMWLNVKWYDGSNPDPIREDGAYGDLPVTHRGQPLTVRTILDPADPNTKIYEAHMGLTQQWADLLVNTLGYDGGMPLMYDRETGDPAYTLGQLAAQLPDSDHESFHFALNNTVVSDNRIPPYRMDYAEARKRNALPVPEDQYDLDENGGVYYDHHDEISIPKPEGAAYATIALMYQPTSWEYIQFLDLANKGTDPAQGGNAFLGSEGRNMLDAWLATGMAEPVAMASAEWGAAPPPCETPAPAIDDAVAGDKQVTLSWSRVAGDPDDFTVYQDQSDKAQWVADVSCAAGSCSYVHAGLANGQEYCYMLTATGECESDFSSIACATPQPPGQQQLAGVSGLESLACTKEGKGKNATLVCVAADAVKQGELIVFRALVTDSYGAPVSGANFDLHINGPEIVDLTSGPSDATGIAEVEWATQGPNKKGNGGTATGIYTATVSGLSAGSLTWDGQPDQVQFTIDLP